MAKIGDIFQQYYEGNPDAKRRLGEFPEFKVGRIYRVWFESEKGGVGCVTGYLQGSGGMFVAIRKTISVKKDQLHLLEKSGVVKVGVEKVNSKRGKTSWPLIWRRDSGWCGKDYQG